MKKLMIAATLLASMSASAGTISSSNLLDQSGADTIESWLGQGDLNWESRWYGESGATAASWHSAVDNIGPTVSIYKILFEGQEHLVGGYSSIGRTNINGYKESADSFIFNLGANLKKHATVHPQYSTYDHSKYFATFGRGHDLSGGMNSIGSDAGYMYSYSYEGNTNLLGSPNVSHFDVLALETFTFSEAQASVPLTGSIALMGLGLLAFRRRK